MQIKNCTMQTKNITCKLKIVLRIENKKHIDAN